MANDEVTELFGKANLGFNVKNKEGISTGSFEFHFKIGHLRIKSTNIDWLVISGNNAYLKGQGRIKDINGYFFFVTAKDYGKPGTGVDEIEITIWDGDPYNPDSSLVHSSKNLLGGGNISIHK